MATPKVIISVCLAIFYIATVECGRQKRGDKKIKVTTIQEKPYLTQDGDQYKGFIPDVLNRISTKSNIEFDIHLVADGVYGKETGGSWNGMIGEIIANTAQLAAAPMTMYDERKRVVDFTEHYMTLGNTIVIRKPKDGSSPAVNSFKELSEQKDIKYGAVKDGFTQQFFEKSTDPVYKKMWEYMSSHSDSMVATNKLGIEKVRSSNYAFIMENTTASYWLHEEPCDLMTVGDVINVNHYAFALRKNDPDNIKSKLNSALNDLKESGEMKKLEDKWWKQDAKCETSAAPYFLPHITWLVVSSWLALLFR